MGGERYLTGRLGRLSFAFANLHGVVSLTDHSASTESAVYCDPGNGLRTRRLCALQAFIVAAGILALAFALQPDPRGFGTHEHLLLPPCLFRTLTHVPCPFCGMTTGFALMARGHLQAAAASNLMAPPAFAATLLVALLALWGLLSGREWAPPTVRRRSFPRVLLVVIVVFWIANILNHLVVQ